MKLCKKCGDEFERQSANQLYCENCREKRIRKNPTIKRDPNDYFNANNVYKVLHDPTPVDEGGYKVGALVGNKGLVERTLFSGGFVDGTVLQLSRRPYTCYKVKNGRLIKERK